MFIDKDEADRRVKRTEKILRSLDGSADSSPNGSHIRIPNGKPVPQPKDEEKEKVDPDSMSEKELKSLLGLSRSRGQRAGGNMTNEERASIGVTSMLLGSREAGILFGRGPETAGIRSRGYTETRANISKELPRAELIAELDRQKKEIRDIAFNRLLHAVDLVTPEKLEKVTDVTKLSRVARDIAAVTDKMMPTELRNEASGVHFHIWKPEMKVESEYEVINLNSPK